MTTKGQRNNRLRIERRLRGWTQVDLVKRMYQAAIDHKLPVPEGLDDNYISRYERGVNDPSPHHVHLLCLAFELASDRLGLVGDAAPQSGTMDAGGSETDRREFLRDSVGATIALLTGGTTDLLARPRPIIDPLAMLEYHNFGATPSESLDLDQLRTRVATAKRAYQSCLYGTLATSLPQLLSNLHAATVGWTGDQRLAAYALSAEAYHVAASLLLKHEDHGPAWLMADRSMSAADRSGNPLMIASSARILTHVFMSTGHLSAATAMASGVAQRFSSMWTKPTAEDLSIYGSLLLRAAIAAARDGNRSTAYDLIQEAEITAQRLGRDENCRWTAFGPTNVRLHQVHVAVKLGDAGTAIELARKIDPISVSVVERRASFFVDTATALAQAGRVEESYRALRSAEALAPEEIAARPPVRQLVVDLLVRAPRHLVPELRALAERVGAVGSLE